MTTIKIPYDLQGAAAVGETKRDHTDPTKSIHNDVFKP